MRTVILDIFKRKYENNDFEYEVILKAIFKDYIPQNFKNIPSFSNSSDLNDVLLFHVLNDNGIKVFLLNVSFHKLLEKGSEASALGVQGNPCRAGVQSSDLPNFESAPNFLERGRVLLHCEETA